MKVVLEISDSRVDFILNLLKKYSFVKVNEIKRPKEELIADIQTAVEEMKLIKGGKLKARPVTDLLDEI
jgi:hypothetical protein